MRPEAGVTHICPPSAHLAGPHGLDVLALVVPDVDEDVVKVPVGHRADMSGLLSASWHPFMQLQQLADATLWC